MSKEMVNSPSHYNKGGIECIDAIKSALGEEGFKAYCRGNALKYTWRAGLKLDEKEDLYKASWYNRMAAGDDPRKDSDYKIIVNPVNKFQFENNDRTGQAPAEVTYPSTTQCDASQTPSFHVSELEAAGFVPPECDTRDEVIYQTPRERQIKKYKIWSKGEKNAV